MNGNCGYGPNNCDEPCLSVMIARTERLQKQACVSYDAGNYLAQHWDSYANKTDCALFSNLFKSFLTKYPLDAIKFVRYLKNTNFEHNILANAPLAHGSPLDKALRQFAEYVTVMDDTKEDIHSHALSMNYVVLSKVRSKNYEDRYGAKFNSVVKKLLAAESSELSGKKSDASNIVESQFLQVPFKLSEFVDAYGKTEDVGSGETHEVGSVKPTEKAKNKASDEDIFKDAGVAEDKIPDAQEIAKIAHKAHGIVPGIFEESTIDKALEKLKTKMGDDDLKRLTFILNALVALTTNVRAYYDTENTDTKDGLKTALVNELASYYEVVTSKGSAKSASASEIRAEFDKAIYEEIDRMYFSYIPLQRMVNRAVATLAVAINGMDALVTWGRFIHHLKMSVDLVICLASLAKTTNELSEFNGRIYNPSLGDDDKIKARAEKVARLPMFETSRYPRPQLCGPC